MENSKPQEWSEVKKIKFHHRVKRFYHKDLFRKIYTVAIIGLIGANVFSLVKYYSVADEVPLQPNTQTADTQQSSGDVVDAGGENEDVNLLSGGVDEGLSGDVEDILSGGVDEALSGDVDEILSGDIDDTLSGDVAEPSLEGNSQTPLGDENTLVEETSVVEQSIDIEDTSFVKESHGTSAIIQGPSIQSISSLEKDTTQWVENEDFFPLDVKASDGETVLFTIMDRNLGATESGTICNSTNTGACGYYYQWGNNYGFANQGTLTNSGTDLVDITGEGYGPGKYYSSDKFIKRTTSPYRWDTDESNETYTQYGNLNLWGGEKVYNPDRDRQGPCPSGYHVPDILEWKAATETWCKEKMGQADGQCNNGYNFRDDLKLPFANYRTIYVQAYDQYGRYWSSSPSPSNAGNSYYFFFSSSSIYPQGDYRRVNGLSVRCFKDSQTTKTLTFDADNGEDNVVYNIRWWEPITKSHNFTPEKEGYKFVGWYNGDEKFNFSDSTFINESTVLTAKWVIEDTTQWVEGEDFEPLEVKASDGQTVLFTIMDRNLGATESGTICNSTNTGACGYYYQWGNNYGFSSEPGTYPANSSRDLVDITGEGYGPGKYYKSSTFIERTTSPYRWDTDNSNETYQQYGNLNLWGGEKVYNPDRDRQGPCPSGYHVPDMLEWKAAREAWCREKMGQANGQCSNGSNFRDDLLLPFAGYRTNYDASIYRQGSDGRYWSSSPYPSNANISYILYLFSSDINPQNNFSRAYGYSVRCFKDSQSTQTLTFDADNGEDNVVYNIRWWEPITKSHNFTPKKEGYKFVGWYEGDAEFNFSDTTFITENTVLNAKWEKNPWFTYDANGGVFADQSSQNVIKYSKIMEKIEYQVSKSYGYKKIEGAPKLYVTAVMIENSCGGGGRVYLYDYEKNNSSAGDDYVVEGVYTELPANIEINGDTMGFYTPGWCGGTHTFNIVVEGDYVTSGVVTQPTREGYTFDGWYVIENETEVDFDPDADNEIKDTTIYARWKADKYTISFDTDGGNDIDPIEVEYNSVVDANSLPVAVKDCNDFLGWDGLVETMPAHDITLKAKYNYTCNSSRYSGGGGRRTSSSDSDSKVHGSADEKDSSKETENTSSDESVNSQSENSESQELDMQKYDDNYSKELNMAYQFAYKNGITTQSSIKNADIEGNLTRIQMAKCCLIMR